MPALASACRTPCKTGTAIDSTGDPFHRPDERFDLVWPSGFADSCLYEHGYVLVQEALRLVARNAG